MLRSPNRLVGLVIGAVLLTLGLVGLVVTAGVGFVDAAGVLLLGALTLNPLQSLVHVLLGAGLLMAALSSVAASRIVNGTAGGLCLVVGLGGLFLVGTDANVLAVNVIGNVIFFASAVALLAVGIGAERPETSR
jgi:hypothetical protein